MSAILGRRWITALCWLALASQTGCAATATESAAADLSGSAATDDEDFGGNGANACVSNVIGLTLDLSDEAALVVSKTPFSPTELATETTFLEKDELATDVWTLDSDGAFMPGTAATSDECDSASEIDVERVDVSPTGEIYLFFTNSVEIAGERCRFVAINLDNQAACADADPDFDVYQVEFTTDGTLYFSDLAGTVKKRDRDGSDAAPLFTASSLGYALDGFKPLNDGTLLLQGDLQGTSLGFYRFVPAAVSGGLDALEEPCLANVDINVKGSAPEDQLFVASDGSIYLRSTGSKCDDLADAKIYAATVGTDGLTFSAVPGIDADSFAEDSLGNVYAVTGADDDALDAATPVNSEPHNAVMTSLAETEIFEVRGDAIYAAGKDASGKASFVRKSLLTGEETDLIGDADLVIQAFDVNAAGDVTFTALDTAQAARVFLRYHSSDASLEELTGFPEDVLKIVYVGTASSEF
jgi:hypothetical protein